MCAKGLLGLTNHEFWTSNLDAIAVD
jgi:hypothetical protein